MPPPLRVWGIRRWCAPDVCLSRTSGLSREQRGLGRPKLAQKSTSHDSDTAFKVKRSKVKVTRPLYSVQALTRKVAAAVSVGTYIRRGESTATLRLLGGARGAWAPIGEERGGGILCHHPHSLLQMYWPSLLNTSFILLVHNVRTSSTKTFDMLLIIYTGWREEQ